MDDIRGLQGIVVGVETGLRWFRLASWQNTLELTTTLEVEGMSGGEKENRRRGK